MFSQTQQQWEQQFLQQWEDQPLRREEGPQQQAAQPYGLPTRPPRWTTYHVGRGGVLLSQVAFVKRGPLATSYFTLVDDRAQVTQENLLMLQRCMMNPHDPKCWDFGADGNMVCRLADIKLIGRGSPMVCDGVNNFILMPAAMHAQVIPGLLAILRNPMVEPGDVTVVKYLNTVPTCPYMVPNWNCKAPSKVGAEEPKPKQMHDWWQGMAVCRPPQAQAGQVELTVDQQPGEEAQMEIAGFSAWQRTVTQSGHPAIRPKGSDLDLDDVIMSHLMTQAWDPLQWRPPDLGEDAECLYHTQLPLVLVGREEPYLCTNPMQALMPLAMVHLVLPQLWQACLNTMPGDEVTLVCRAPPGTIGHDRLPVGFPQCQSDAATNALFQ